MQRWRRAQSGGSAPCFNPHPSRRTGATCEAQSIIATTHVSILTRPGGRVQPEHHEAVRGRERFQSSPVPEDGCNTGLTIYARDYLLVSILTRPGGRVQHGERATLRSMLESFNPHPSRRTGATPSSVPHAVSSCWFQSSPVPEDGCNNAGEGDAAQGDCFNPHPSRRTGATLCRRFCAGFSGKFQSSPVPEDGCNSKYAPCPVGSRRFQSSPVPEDGCNRGGQ